MTLHVHLLGPAEISRDGDLLALPGHKPLALLAYLLVTGKPHSRQHLVDLLFEGPDDPRAALRWTLSKLRKAIGAEYILADRQEIGFNLESGYWLDVTAFEAGQVDLYRGDFLEGLHVREAYRFEDWAFFERERLRGSYQNALTQQLEAYERREDDAAVVETAHQLLRLDNLREDWYRALMEAYARLGNREAALAQYAQCRQVLGGELGVEPVPETVALSEAIQAGRLGLTRPRPAPDRSLTAGRFALDDLEKRRQPRFPSRLVGRETEMAALRQVWGRAAQGAGGIVLVDGEPGIGKTRLIEELLAEVTDQALVLRAKCIELEEPLAYTLFVDPLREALSGGRPPRLTDAWLAEVGRLLPEVWDRYPDLPQPVALDPAAERRRLFDAVCAILLSLAENQPLALFLDDLQWADGTSLELLNHLSGRMAKVPILILGAYRPYEVEAGHPLHRPRQDWMRRGSLTSLSLEPLTEASVADLLQALTTWRGDDTSFGAFIYRETAGNPLFVVETVASLRDEGRLPESAEGWGRDFRSESLTVPSQVQGLIQARLDRLDELSSQVLTAGAVMQGSFEAEAAQAVSGRSELETLESLEHLLESGLLIEAGEDRFTFSHDKIREVAYGGLSRLRRRLLHRRAAETLERRRQGREESAADRLAYHYERADVSDKALEYHLQAGRTAQEQMAYEAAIGHYQKALSYLVDQDDCERSARTLMQLGWIYHTLFDFERARQAYQEGFVLWQRVEERGQSVTSLLPAPHPLRVQSLDPISLDPAFADDSFSNDVIDQLFSGLAELRPGGVVVPDIARSWEVSGDGRKYVFYLRDDVRWSDGRPVTAGDFEYAWKRVLDPGTGSPRANIFFDIYCARAFHSGQVSDPDQIGVRAVDDLTLAVELDEPTGYFPGWMAAPWSFPVPRHLVEAQGRAWAEPGNIVSNGPLRLEAWERGQAMVLARNPDYHGRFSGNLERVELAYIKDSSASLAAYEDDRLDILSFLGFPPAEIDRARQRHAGEYLQYPRPLTYYIGFRISCPPFDDVRVRQAFGMAIDKERLANVVLRGHNIPGTGGLVPPGIPGHSPGIGLPYDPERARQLLAEAGYPGGRGFPTVDAFRPSFHSLHTDYARSLWRENLGVEIAWQDADFETLDDELKGEQPMLFALGWVADFYDPDYVLRVGVQAHQPVWRNETYHHLIEKARRVTDQAQRLVLYGQADRILMSESVVIPIAYARGHLLVKPWVKRYPVSSLKTWFWKDVIIEPH